MSTNPDELRLYGHALKLNLSSDPDARIRETIDAMRALIHDTDNTQTVHRLATELAAAQPFKDFRAQLHSVFDFIGPVERGGRMQFMRDTAGKEHLRHPDQLVHEIQTRGVTAGDCDDRAMLGAALLRAMGFKTVLIVVGRLTWEHVFCGVAIGRRRQIWPVDPQETEALGQWPPFLKREIFFVDE